MKIFTITLAAGNGTRMKSSTPKPLHKIAGMTILNWSVRCFDGLNVEKKILVASEDLIAKDSSLNDRFSIVIQNEKLGTGHAVKICRDLIDEKSDIVIINYGDTPFVKSETIQNMISKLQSCDCVFLGFKTSDISNKYGRFIINQDQLIDIVEFKDASDSIREIDLCNSGIVAIKTSVLLDNIDKIDNKNAACEYYLTDLVKILKNSNKIISFVKCDDSEVLGVNSRSDLAMSESAFQDSQRDRFMNEGVTMRDPKTVFFSHDTVISNDVEIEPFVFFGQGVSIKSGSKIFANSYLENVLIGKNCSIGPFARLRSNSNIEDSAVIGNFVEVKGSTISKNAKAKHLSYIGDATVGEGANIGAGTITCNYNGFEKFKTHIGKNVMIGANSTLVAPVMISDGAYIAAGSVITEDVGPNNLAISRTQQQEKNAWALSFRAKYSKKLS
jgi:bifunctional UDP-N-acetylglucosamine pyrophosphorylase/glucosamine-1-phosphate N-acetyltransferase